MTRRILRTSRRRMARLRTRMLVRETIASSVNLLTAPTTLHSPQLPRLPAHRRTVPALARMTEPFAVVKPTAHQLATRRAAVHLLALERAAQIADLLLPARTELGREEGARRAADRVVVAGVLCARVAAGRRGHRALVVAADLGTAGDGGIEDGSAAEADHLGYISLSTTRQSRDTPPQKSYADRADTVLDDRAPRSDDSRKSAASRIRDRTRADRHALPRRSSPPPYRAVASSSPSPSPEQRADSICDCTGVVRKRAERDKGDRTESRSRRRQ